MSDLSRRVLAKYLQAEEAIPKDTVFEVVMKHGTWWTEMRRGLLLVAAEDGKLGTKMGFKEKGSVMGTFQLTPIVQGGKMRLVAGPGRALTVVKK